MRDKIIFFVMVVFAAITISPTVGIATAAIGHMVGLTGAALLVLVGSAATAAFGAILALATLLASLLFGK